MTERFVHIVDDEPSVRSSLSWLCRSAGLACREFASAEALLGSVSLQTRGVVLLDMRMPGMGGLGLIERHVPDPVAMPVIVLTAHGDVQSAVKAVSGGARTMLEKPVDSATLMAEVQAALAAEERNWSRLSEVIELRELLASLSAREGEVMELVASGWTSQDIGTVLGISKRTVEIHRSRVFAKTRCDNAADLAGRLAELASFGFGRGGESVARQPPRHGSSGRG